MQQAVTAHSALLSPRFLFFCSLRMCERLSGCGARWTNFHASGCTCARACVRVRVRTRMRTRSGGVQAAERGDHVPTADAVRDNQLPSAAGHHIRRECVLGNA